MTILLSAVLQLLPGRFMDVRMRASQDYDTRVVERPGRWMEPGELERLTEDLRLVASKTLKAGSLTYGVFSGDRKRLEQSIVTIVYRRGDGRPIAFNALAVMELSLAGKTHEVLHLGLVMVDPDERGRGLSWILYGLTCFLMFLRNQFRPIWISNVTQVPAVVGMVAEAFSNVFPGPHSGARRSLTHVLLARQIMARHRHVFGVGADAVFDEERFVISNAYTGGSDELKKSFQETAKHRVEAFNEFCQKQLDYGRGDDVLQIGQMNFQAARAFLANTVPRGSLAALAVTGAAATLQRLVLPVVHWADASRQWNLLRPWTR
ncbi:MULTISPECIES: hypothetical protein [unclassified Mesorhizobium]|uniref:hypothetical protein n=1 Tax=unclassified Mesorhizobium TaxID=325217 RepID=UPI000BAF6368|nr:MULTISPECIES: hypothetical protein [unclassified Mesorhizobium]PBB84957.1 hypothetical protein CK216_20645 [Mesorhizobium sp. WSM3876]RWE27285.1 MAG: hypothetical protein EOS41_03565 [Mesorhizobium sp.]TGT54418.1 hypothetical protein EN813_043370 [Mesorhizobium sp. M00.F.Ca.ET.170.01.1.1]